MSNQILLEFLSNSDRGVFKVVSNQIAKTQRKEIKAIQENGKQITCLEILYAGLGGENNPTDPPLDCSDDPIQGVFYLERGSLVNEYNPASLWESTGDNQTPWTQIEQPSCYYYFEKSITECCDESDYGNIFCINQGERIKVEDLLSLTLGCQILDSVHGILYLLTPEGWKVDCKIGSGNKIKCLEIKYNGIGGISPPRNSTETPFGDQIQVGTYFLDYGGDADLLIATGLLGPVGINAAWSTVHAGSNPYYYFERTNPNNNTEGRIWCVDPVTEDGSTQNGSVTRIENLCNLSEGDKVIDSKSGKIYVLEQKNGCEGIWKLECVLKRGTKYLSGNICYQGSVVFDSPSVNDPNEYSLSLFTGILYHKVDNNWQVLNNTPVEYYYLSTQNQIYYVRHPGSLINACNLCDEGVEQTLVQNLVTECCIVPGDKFFDCCKNELYTYLNEDKQWTLLCNELENCPRCDNGPAFDQTIVGCIKYDIGQTTVNYGPILPPTTAGYNEGDYFLQTNGQLFQVVGGNWFLVNIPFIQYYYLTNENLLIYVQLPNPNPNIEPSKNACGLIVDPVVVPATYNVVEECNLKFGDKFLDCCRLFLYQYDLNGWYIVCDLNTVIPDPLCLNEIQINNLACKDNSEINVLCDLDLNNNDVFNVNNLSLNSLNGGNVGNLSGSVNTNFLFFNGTEYIPKSLSADDPGAIQNGCMIRNQGNFWNANALQGVTISGTTPNPNEVLTYNGSVWIPVPSSGGIGNTLIGYVDPVFDNNMWPLPRDIEEIMAGGNPVMRITVPTNTLVRATFTSQLFKTKFVPQSIGTEVATLQIRGTNNPTNNPNDWSTLNGRLYRISSPVNESPNNLYKNDRIDVSFCWIGNTGNNTTLSVWGQMGPRQSEYEDAYVIYSGITPTIADVDDFRLRTTFEVIRLEM